VIWFYCFSVLCVCVCLFLECSLPVCFTVLCFMYVYAVYFSCILFLCCLTWRNKEWLSVNSINQQKGEQNKQKPNVASVINNVNVNVEVFAKGLLFKLSSSPTNLIPITCYRLSYLLRKLILYALLLVNETINTQDVLTAVVWCAYSRIKTAWRYHWRSFAPYAVYVQRPTEAGGRRI